MMTIADWAARWAIPAPALADLLQRFGVAERLPAADPSLSEAGVQSRVRLKASKLGLRVWRNNVGAGYSEDGSFMRWGLANDSAQVNKVIKSADLIGIRPRIVVPEDVGKVLGQFVSWEIKHAGWKYTGDEREAAQLAWAKLVASLGGEARFVTSEDEV